MAYIGTEPIVGQYRKLDSIAASFNGSATTFNLTVGSVPVTAGTAYQLLISVGGVVQEPGVDYTVSTNTITFTTAPTTGLSFFGVLMGDTLNIGTPSDGTITDAKLGSITTLSATNLRVNGATSGYSQLNAPAVAGNQTFTFPGTGGTLDRLNRAGNVLQVVNTTSLAYASGSGNIPIDDTIPQNTEGNEFMTLAITPTSSSSKLLISVKAVLGTNIVTWFTGALFQDSTANAIAAAVDYLPAAGTTATLCFDHFMTAGTTSATTFKFRAGSQTGSIYLNGVSSTRLMGGTCTSSITITEIAA